jgi:hypothetical protein
MGTSHQARTVNYGDNCLHDKEPFYYTKLASLKDILACQSICTLCSLIACHLRLHVTQDEIDHFDAEYQPVEIRFFNPFVRDSDGDQPILRFIICTALFSVQQDFDLLFSFDDATKADELDMFAKSALERCARPVIQEDQIDWKIVRRWLLQCEAGHDICRISTALDSDFGKNICFRLIDVHQKAVVVVNRIPRFVALSYVWGSADRYKGRYYAESVSLDYKSLPRTVRDAMQVVRSIGERYLWVDAVCISQKDEVEKTATIGAMNQIYASAILTIIAASGVDANAGFAGVQPNSRSIRSLPGTVDGIRLHRWEPEYSTRGLPWTQRGWTYQEGHFSSKKLIFAHDRVFY